VFGEGGLGPGFERCFGKLSGGSAASEAQLQGGRGGPEPEAKGHEKRYGLAPYLC